MQSSTKGVMGIIGFLPFDSMLRVCAICVTKSVEMHAFNGTTDLNTLDIAFLGIAIYILGRTYLLRYLSDRLQMFGNDKKWFWRTLMLFGHVVAFAVFGTSIFGKEQIEVF